MKLEMKKISLIIAICLYSGIFGLIEATEMENESPSIINKITVDNYTPYQFELSFWAPDENGFFYEQTTESFLAKPETMDQTVPNIKNRDLSEFAALNLIDRGPNRVMYRNVWVYFEPGEYTKDKQDIFKLKRRSKEEKGTGTLFGDHQGEYFGKLVIGVTKDKAQQSIKVTIAYE